jgi:dTDP-L-rhamnose 4-epimerase
VRVLLTGAAGFIGSHVAQALRSAGHDVVGLDCLHPAAHQRSRPSNDPGLIVGDVRDPATVRAALREVDAVCHQAAMVGMGVDLLDAPEYASCNDFGTAVLLAELTRAGIRHLVLASSMVVYGEGGYRCPRHGSQRPGPRPPGCFEPLCPACGSTLESTLVDEDAPLDPRSIYAATKLAQEHLTAAWARATDSVAIALRYHNVYGPHMPRDTPYSGVAAIFRSSLERGESPLVFEDGGQRRDFVHVTDIAAANLLALTAQRPQGTMTAYNVASGVPHTILDMATTLASAMGGPPPTVTGTMRHGDVRHIVASPARAQHELGYTAMVPFAEGIRDFASAPLRSVAA